MTTRPFRFGVIAGSAASLDAWQATARRVEALDRVTLLVPDRLGLATLAPLPALAAAAAATRALRLGTFVLATGLRNPALLAHECATLARLAGGRLELGFGAGVSEADFRHAGIPFGSPGERLARLAEAVRIVKQTIRRPGPGALADVRPDRAPTATDAVQVPILVAGSGRRLLALAGREADIVAIGLPPAATEPDLQERVAWLRDAAGDRFADLELSQTLIAIADGSPTEARVRARMQATMRLDLDDLIAQGSAAVVRGSVDDICQQLSARRARLGISYVTVAEDMLEAFVPVIHRLAGR